MWLWRAKFGVTVSDFDSVMGNICGGNHFGELQCVERLVDTKRCADLGLIRVAFKSWCTPVRVVWESQPTSYYKVGAAKSGSTFTQCANLSIAA